MQVKPHIHSHKINQNATRFSPFSIYPLTNMTMNFRFLIDPTMLPRDLDDTMMDEDTITVFKATASFQGRITLPSSNFNFYPVPESNASQQDDSSFVIPPTSITDGGMMEDDDISVLTEVSEMDILIGSQVPSSSWTVVTTSSTKSYDNCLMPTNTTSIDIEQRKPKRQNPETFSRRHPTKRIRNI
jgi:hypothetical protein